MKCEEVAKNDGTICRIAVFGLNGSGKSTLAHALAKKTGYWEMDIEDYYFPQQREARRISLEGLASLEAEQTGTIPFADSKTKEEVQNALLRDIETHSGFILSCVSMNWNAEILSHIEKAFWLQTPTEIRMQRIRLREETRFGERVMPGGDMFHQQMEFRRMAESRNEQMLLGDAEKLICPVFKLDGELSVEENVRIVMEIIKAGGK